MNCKAVKVFSATGMTFITAKVKIDTERVVLKCDDTVSYQQQNSMTLKTVVGRTVWFSRENWNAMSEDDLNKVLRGEV